MSTRTVTRGRRIRPAWQWGIACAILLFACAAPAADLTVEAWRMPPTGVADSPLRIRAWLPPEYAATEARYPVLYVNDGQDMEAVGLADTLQTLYAEGALERIIVVAIDMPQDRMAAYGVFDRASGRARVAHTRHGMVGTRADAYARWLVEAVLPAVEARYRTLPRPEGRSLLGWSLGGTSAFAIAWQYPELFGKVGAFSPAFWLAADGHDAASTQATRLVQAMVDGSAPGPRPKLFIGVGSAEETDDRDGDGVIDVVDDARDLVDGWQRPDGTLQRGLRQLGLQAHHAPASRRTRDPVALLELPGGRHDQASWARMLPVFLCWAHAMPADARRTAKCPSVEVSAQAAQPGSH